MTKRKGRGLSPEDQSLWNRVAQTATPLRPQALRPIEIIIETKPKTKPSQPERIREFELGTRSSPRTSTADLAPTPAESLGRAPVNMDKRAFSKLKRGKMQPTSRLDLHGMTQAQAHPRLTAFIASCFARGDRLVLVITGKGKSKADDGPIPTRIGVLRHQVPHWLSLPPLSQMILQVVPAHLKHGGEGAYYVYLRRSR